MVLFYLFSAFFKMEMTAEVLGRTANNDWWVLTRFVEGHFSISFLKPFRTRLVSYVWYWLTLFRERGEWDLWLLVAPSRSLIPFCLLGNLTREVDLVCASEGLVTIVTCSSGEAGNIVAGQGIGEEWTTFWLCIDWFLIAATENGHAQQGDWIYWYPELAGHCISLELMEMLFPITSNTAITVSCKRLLTMAVSVLLALLLGIIETDGMLGLQILRDLRSPSSSFNLITSSLKTSSSLSKHQ